VGVRLELRPVRPPGWWPDAVLLVGFVALTLILAGGGLLGLDRAVADWCLAHQPAVPHAIARGLNYLGNGGPLALIGLALGLFVAWRIRSWRPVLVPVAAFLLTTLVILPLKYWTDRAAPRSTLPDAVELFNHLPPGEYGQSYPSGHIVVAIVWYGALLLVLEAVVRVPPPVHRAIRVVPVVVVLVTTTYLGFHWVSDGLAGLLVGLLLDRLFSRVPWMPAR